MKLIMSLAVKTNGKKEIIAQKKTQIPVKVKAESQQKAVKPKKKSEAPTVFTFRTLQAALHSLSISELQHLLDATKMQFNNDVTTLKTAVAFLNEKLRLEKAEGLLFPILPANFIVLCEILDVMVFDKPLDYPSSILSAELKSILNDLIAKCNEEKLKYLFHNLLQSLCEELNKSRNFVGYLLMLQQIALYLPEVCVSNLASTVILRNSYQNQPSICLSLFWALVSSGYRDTTIGLKVWMEIVSSVMNTKSYTKFAIDCLHKILSASGKTPALKVSLLEYKTLIEVLVSNNEKVKTKELQKTKWKCISLVTRKYIESLDTDHLEHFFKLMCTFCKRNPDIFAAEFVELVKAFPVECIRLWEENFDNFSRQNAFVFGYLGELKSIYRKFNERVLIPDKVQDSEQLIEHPKFLDFIKSIDYRKYPNLLFVRVC